MMTSPTACCLSAAKSRPDPRRNSSDDCSARAAKRAWAALILIGAMTAGCGKIPPVTEADVVPVDLQSVPSWKPEWAGRPIGEAMSAARLVSDCVGFIDAATDIGAAAQTRLEGWAWNTADAARFDLLMVTDLEGKVTGAGVTVVDRGDVRAALPRVVNQERVGFIAFSATTAGGLTVYGVDQAQGTLCAIGSTG